MTTTVINHDSLATFNYAAGGDTLVILSDGNIAPSTGAAVGTSYGDANLSIEGSAVGAIGFYDSSTKGGDVIGVGQGGSLIGTVSDALDAGDGSFISNAGLIQSLGGYGIFSGSGNTIDNEGHIDAFGYAISDEGGDEINNSGTIHSSNNSYSTITEDNGGNKITNSGLISSNDGQFALFLAGEQNTVENTGTIDGALTAVRFDGSDSYLSNSGTISGLSDAVVINGSAGDTTIKNSGLIEAEGNAELAINFADSGQSDALINSGSVLGSVSFAGFYAEVVNSGEIDGSAAFSVGFAMVRNSGDISESVYFSGNNNSYYGAAGTVEGEVYLSGSNGTFIGGAHGTTFIIDASQLAITDTIAGGASADDTLEIQGSNTKITALDLKNVSGFETISVAGSNSIIITEALADSAEGHALTIDTGAGAVINLTGVTSKTDAISVWAAVDDKITAGASRDTFGFAGAYTSTGVDYETIAGVNLGHDKFDVSLAAGAIIGINKAVTSGKLSTSTFDADLAADLGPKQLGADHAVLFTASSGTLKGDTFLVIDANATAGYQAGQDLVIRLTGATGTLSTANFL